MTSIKKVSAKKVKAKKKVRFERKIEKEVLRYAALGESDKHWYRDCKRTIVKIFGEKDVRLVANLLAATSMNTTLKANITLFCKAYKILKLGGEFEGKFLPVMVSSLERVREGKELNGRKTRNFARAMRGDTSAVVVDMWILQAFDRDKYRKFKGKRDKVEREIMQSATVKDFDDIESWIKWKAKEINLQPRQLCSMIWSGIRKEKTKKDNPTRYCDFLINKFYSPLFDIYHILQ